MRKFNLNQEVETSFEIEVLLGSIYIDSSDVELPSKVEKMYNTFDKGIKEIEQKEFLLNKKNLDEKQKNQEKLKIMLEFVDMAYKSINSLFGEGATDKIFRVKSIVAIETFLDNLIPIFQELEVLSDDIMAARIEKSKCKYKPLEVNTSEIEELD